MTGSLPNNFLQPIHISLPGVDHTFGDDRDELGFQVNVVDRPSGTVGVVIAILNDHLVINSKVVESNADGLCLCHVAYPCHLIWSLLWVDSEKTSTNQFGGHECAKF